MYRRYYYTLLLFSGLSACCLPSFGQNIDLFAEIDMDAHPNLCPGKMFGDSTTAAGPKGTWSVGTYGPATIYENTTVWYVNSMSRFLTEYERDSLSAAPGSFWMQKQLIQENIPAPDYLHRESDRPVNDVGILLDWEQYQSGTFSYIPPPYEDGKAYGFFVHVIGTGSNPGAITNTDNNEDNNWAVKKIVWGCAAVSAGTNLPGAGRETLKVYPNPATDHVGFDHEFTGPGELKMTIRTMTGNIVMQRTEQVKIAGRHHFSLDIGQLCKGLYLLDLSAGGYRSTGKFVLR